MVGFYAEVCVPQLFLRQDGMGLEVTSQIARTGTGLHMSGLVAWDNTGKIGDGTGLLSTTQEILKWSWNELKSKTFLEIQYWTRNFLHSIVFLNMTNATKTIIEKTKLILWYLLPKQCIFPGLVFFCHQPWWIFTLFGITDLQTYYVYIM